MVGCRHEELALFLDDAAHVIRQAAVGERDIFAALHDDDFIFFGKPAETGRAGCTPRHAAHDHDFPGHRFPHCQIACGVQEIATEINRLGQATRNY